MYLVDTNVISAISPGRTGPPGLDIWLRRNSEHLYLSAVTIAEIEAGIAKARRTGSRRTADNLAVWLGKLLHLYEARILPLDTQVARVLGKLIDLSRSMGVAPGFADLSIAATAITRGHTVLTRNIRHFQDMPIRCHDPFESEPSA